MVEIDVRLVREPGTEVDEYGDRSEGEDGDAQGALRSRRKRVDPPAGPGVLAGTVIHLPYRPALARS